MKLYRWREITFCLHEDHDNIDVDEFVAEVDKIGVVMVNEVDEFVVEGGKVVDEEGRTKNPNGKLQDHKKIEMEKERNHELQTLEDE
ncbi:hypothetical protein RJT34_17139 [Clitoria ternatea]|uniref:Uncharacterized protein n=1 Tax=Clitoria ternatea TaxID=43366 RepID=A0AAN9J8E4_CLITE